MADARRDGTSARDDAAGSAAGSGSAESCQSVETVRQDRIRVKDSIQSRAGDSVFSRPGLMDGDGPQDPSRCGTGRMRLH